MDKNVGLYIIQNFFCYTKLKLRVQALNKMN